MIITNGIDIIDIRRIKKTIEKYGNKFKLRCFSLSEIQRSEKKLKQLSLMQKDMLQKKHVQKL